MFSLGQTKGNKKTKAMVKETKDKLKDVKISDTVESGIRKDQHNGEIAHKKTAVDQKKKNMDVKSKFNLLLCFLRSLVRWSRADRRRRLSADANIQ